MVECKGYSSLWYQYRNVVCKSTFSGKYTKIVMQVEMWCHSQGVPGLYQRKDYSHIQRDILCNTQRFEKKTRKCTKTLQKEGIPMASIARQGRMKKR